MGAREPGLNPDDLPAHDDPEPQLPAPHGSAREPAPEQAAGPGPELPETESWVIDGIEAGIARLEDPRGRFFEVPVAWLPVGAAAADVLRVGVSSTHQGAALTLRRDDAEAQRRLDEAGERLERLRRRDPGGNIDL